MKGFFYFIKDITVKTTSEISVITAHTKANTFIIMLPHLGRFSAIALNKIICLVYHYCKDIDSMLVFTTSN